MAVDGCEYLLFGFLSLVIHINYKSALCVARRLVSNSI